jgi:hypothetical protein
MKLSAMTISSSIFSFISMMMFVSLFHSRIPVSPLIINISLALLFFAMAVMNVLVKVHKRRVGQLRQPVRLGSVVFGLTGLAGATRSMSLGLSTGAWEYWAIMTNMLFFVVSVLVLWYNKFIEKLLQDIKEK